MSNVFTVHKMCVRGIFSGGKRTQRRQFKTKTKQNHMITVLFLACVSDLLKKSQVMQINLPS